MNEVSIPSSIFKDSIPRRQFDTQDTGPVATLQVRVGTGILETLVIGNEGATSTHFLQIHDAASTPDAGTLPVFPSIPLTGSNVITVDSLPLYFANGLSLVVSETEDDYTVSTDEVSIFGTLRH